MNKIYTKVEKEMRESYFPALRLTGVQGIIMPSDKVFSQNIQFAKKSGLFVWIEFDGIETVESKRVEYNTFGVGSSSAKITSFSFDGLKKLVSELSKDDIEALDGIILKYPSHSGMLWDESFKDDFFSEFSNYVEDYIPILFEDLDEDKNAFRSWYFDKCHKFIYNTYVKPAISWTKKIGISLSFHIGEDKTSFFYFIEHISVMDLLEDGVSLCVYHDKEGITEHGVLLSRYGDGNFIFTNEYDERLDGLDANIIGYGNAEAVSSVDNSERILLIRSDRAIAESYYEFTDSIYMSSESESIVNSFNSTFYTDKLYQKGYNFEITNERYFEKYAEYNNGTLTYKNKEINRILICDKCIFSDDTFELLKTLKKDGFSINNSKIIKDLGLDKF